MSAILHLTKPSRPCDTEDDFEQRYREAEGLDSLDPVRALATGVAVVTLVFVALVLIVWRIL